MSETLEATNQQTITMKKIIYISTLSFLFTFQYVFSQNVGINGTGAIAHASALLDLDDAGGGNNKGLLIPRIPLTAINAAAPVTSPATSLLVYNTASASTGTNVVSPGYYYWDGTKWVRFAYTASGSSSTAWDLLGNAGTNPTTNFLGTTDAQDLVFRTNNLEAVRITTAGNLGIGTSSPFGAKTYVNSTTGNALYISSPNDGIVFLTKGYNTGLLGAASTSGWLTRSNDNTSPFGLNLPNALTFEFWNGITYTNSTTFLPNGNVGIGTITPGAKLHVFSGDVFIADNTQTNFNVSRTGQSLWLDNIRPWSDNGLRIYDGNTNGHIHIGNIGQSYFQSYATTSTVTPGILGTSFLDFDDASNFSALSLNPVGGNVGIGTMGPSEKLEVQGSVKIVDGTQGSDKILTSDATGKGSWQDRGFPLGTAFNIPPTTHFTVTPGIEMVVANTIVIPYDGFFLFSSNTPIYSNGFIVPDFDTYIYLCKTSAPYNAYLSGGMEYFLYNNELKTSSNNVTEGICYLTAGTYQVRVLNNSTNATFITNGTNFNLKSVIKL